ncbi:MAG: hypothetical protein ACJ72E_05410 [Marmoricola sp.]
MSDRRAEAKANRAAELEELRNGPLRSPQSPNKTCIACGEVIAAQATNCPYCREPQSLEPQSPEAEREVSQRTPESPIEKIARDVRTIRIFVQLMALVVGVLLLVDLLNR